MPSIWENGVYLFTPQNNLQWWDGNLNSNPTNYPIPYQETPNSLVFTGKPLQTIDLNISNLGLVSSSISPDVSNFKNTDTIDWVELKRKELLNGIKPDSSEIFQTTPKLSKFKNFMKSGGYQMIGLAADVLNNILPEKSEALGPNGEIVEGMDLAFNQVSDAIMATNPLVGGIIKTGGFIGKALNSKIGTDGMTKTDAILGSSFLNMTPFGLINGLKGKRANSFRKDYDAYNTVGSSYSGVNSLVDDALSKLNKKYGWFSRHKRHSANRLIDKASLLQDIMSDISDYTQDRLAIKDSMSAINGNNQEYDLNGGYLQAFHTVGKNGMKLLLKRAKDIISKSKKLLNGGPIDSYNYYLMSLPPNLQDNKGYRMHRYWELNGSPRDFEQAKLLGMFTENEDGLWHANSVAYNKDTDEFEFMKSPDHDSIWMEEAWYNGFEPRKLPFTRNYSLNIYDYQLIPLKGDKKEESDNFRNNYELDKSGDYWKYTRRNKIDSYKKGGSIIELIDDIKSEIELITPDSIEDDIEEFKDGGEINIIPEGALHARKHNMETEGITKKGIPVVAEKEGGELEQQAEIEREEIIFRLEVTKKLESLEKKYYSEETSQKEKDELALEAGKLLTEEILHNTQDNTNNLL